MSAKKTRAAGAAAKAAVAPKPRVSGRSSGGMAKRSYSIPITAATHAEKLAEAQGISTSALVGRAIEELYEQTQRIVQAREIAQELLAETIDAHGPLTPEDTSAVDAFLAEVKMAGA